MKKSAKPAASGKLVKNHPTVTFTDAPRPRKTLDGIPFKVANARQNKADRERGRRSELRIPVVLELTAKEWERVIELASFNKFTFDKEVSALVACSIEASFEAEKEIAAVGGLRR